MSAVLLNKLPAHSQPREIYYPVADGAPMGETDFHISLIIELILARLYPFFESPLAAALLDFVSVDIAAFVIFQHRVLGRH